MTDAPREIANRAEALVLTLPQRILSLLLRSATGGAIARDTALVTDAHAFMAGSFVPTFANAINGTLPEPLSEAHARLLTTLDGLLTSLPDALGDASPPLLAQIGDVVSEELTPAISAFLAALFDAVVAAEKAAARRMKDVDNSALSQIDEIAQTINFIAINASVEAAHAGDAGKGFAVIATQIRELSQKSKDAVDRIRSAFA